MPDRAEPDQPEHRAHADRSDPSREDPRLARRAPEPGRPTGNLGGTEPSGSSSEAEDAEGAAPFRSEALELARQSVHSAQELHGALEGLPMDVPLPRELTAAAPRAQARRPDTLQQLGRFSAIGMTFALTVCACAFIGWLMDRWLNSAPAGILVGLGFGLIGGLVQFLRLAREAMRSSTGSAGRHNARSGRSTGSGRV